MTINELFDLIPLFEKYELEITRQYFHHIPGKQEFIGVRLMNALHDVHDAIDVTKGVDEFSLKKTQEKLKKELDFWENPPAIRGKTAPMVMGDIQPYISQIDGSLIESRSKHRAHLKANNCIEIGNEIKHLKHNKPLESPPGLKEHLIRAVNESQEKLKRRY
jgi:hypothetical protein